MTAEESREQLQLDDERREFLRKLYDLEVRQARNRPDSVPDEQREMARKVYDLEVRQNRHSPSTDSDTTREMRNSIAGR